MKKVSPRRFPKHVRKYSETPLFTAAQFTARLPRSPRNVIFVYNLKLAEIIAHELALDPTDEPYGGKIPVRNYVNGSHTLYMMMPGPGSPMTATVADELHSLGADNFLILGEAGSLSPKAHIGDIVLCKKALRDEGVSHHLLPPSLYVYPNPDLVAYLKTGMKSSGIRFIMGPTWTVDFPYAETLSEIEAYRNLGVVTVEMEAAALFALGKARRFRSAAVFTVSDMLTDHQWTGMRDTSDGKEKLAEVARIFSKMTL